MFEDSTNLWIFIFIHLGFSRKEKKFTSAPFIWLFAWVLLCGLENYPFDQMFSQTLSRFYWLIFLRTLMCYSVKKRLFKNWHTDIIGKLWKFLNTHTILFLCKILSLYLFLMYGFEVLLYLKKIKLKHFRSRSQHAEKHQRDRSLLFEDRFKWCWL